MKNHIVVKSAEQRLLLAEVYSPLHIDTDGEAMTAEDIRNMAHKFLSSGRVRKIDVQHNQKESGCEVVESFIARKHDPDGFIEGSWVLGIHVVPDDVWEAVKKGELNGLSFFGSVVKVPARARVTVTRKMVGQTEESLDGILPPHLHDVTIDFSSNGKILEGLTEETLNHRHRVSKATATEMEWEHAHRLILVENDEEEKVAKGGPGSGSWEGPGDPRFQWQAKPKEKSGNKEEISGRFKGKPLDKYGKDTEHMYREKNPDGSWGDYTPERKALHEEIIRSVIGDATPVDTPVSYLMGGGTASGKSSLRKSGKLGIPENLVTIDSDDIKEYLPEYRAMLSNKDFKAAAFAHEESSYLSKKILKQASDAKLNVLLDGTGDSEYSKLAQKVQSLKTQGQKVIAHYADIKMEDAVSRSRSRAEKTGRYVPEAFIRQVYKKVSQAVPQALENGLFDEFTLWNNQTRTPVKVASAKGRKLSVYEQDLWDEFLKRGT